MCGGGGCRGMWVCEGILTVIYSCDSFLPITDTYLTFSVGRGGIAYLQAAFK